jgi:hypothetical protein
MKHGWDGTYSFEYICSEIDPWQLLQTVRRLVEQVVDSNLVPYFPLSVSRASN